MRQMRIFVLLLFALACHLPLWLSGQQYAFRSINDDGMPTSQAYSIYQDRKGYIWICTRSGLVKYNGKSFNVFTKDRGLEGNIVIKVWEDSQNRLFYFTSSGGVGYIKNDTVYKLPIADKLMSMLVNGSYYITDICEYDADNLLIATQKGLYSLDKKTLNTLTLLSSQACRGNYDIKIINGVAIIAADTTTFDVNETSFFHRYILHIDVAGQKRRVVNFNTPVNQYGKGFFRVLYLKDKRILISHEQRLSIIYPDNHIENIFFKHSIVSLLQDRNGGVWICTSQDGFFYYSIPDFNLPAKRVLPELNPTSAMMDKYGGMWVTTRADGIFYCSSLEFINYAQYKSLRKNMYTLAHIPPYIIAGGLGDTIYAFKNRNNYKSYVLDAKRLGAIFDFEKVGDKVYVAGGLNSAILDTNFRIERFIRKCCRPAYALAKTGADEIIALYDKVYYLDDSNLNRAVPLYEECIDIAIDDSDRVYVGTTQGLYVLRNNVPIKVKEVDHGIRSLKFDDKGYLWLCTLDDGLWKFDILNFKVVNKFLNKQDLPSRICADAAFDVRGNVWVATNKGVACIRNDSEIERYTIWDGLLSNEVNKLQVLGNELYIGTAKGLCVVDIEKLRLAKAKPLLYIDNITVNSKIVNKQSIFEHKENSVVFTLEGLFFKSPYNLTYYYRLFPSDTIWHTSVSEKINYLDLRPGTYIFQAYVVAYDGTASDGYVTCQFTIKKPFWAVWWFILLEIILVLSIGGLVLFLQTRSTRKRAMKKAMLSKQIEEYKLAAVQAQMNPHFIFNAINSIQHYILSHETQYAYNYLTLFSKLIRQVLINSHSTTITLRKELDLLELYIELESRRFENKFSYKVNYENIPIEDIQIPGMLIQPFVENAIWHGIMNLSDIEKGKLSVDLLMEENMLKISIKDNGVGRAKTLAANSEKQHKSIGMMLSKNKIDIIRALNLGDASIVITDLYDNGNAIGTLVEITLSIY